MGRTEWYNFPVQTAQHTLIKIYRRLILILPTIDLSDPSRLKTVFKRMKNGHCARADVVGMGPSGLDGKNGTAQSSVRSGWISRSLCREPRRRHPHPNEGREAILTPL